MAIKAKEQITVVDVTDIDHVAKYYLMQSSTLSKPAKPTALPPGGGWAITEPAYTDGSTNSLYTVELTVWSNDTYDYSDVSLSSSFEAAKAAYNKANAAQDSAEDAKAAITVSATPPASPVVGQLWQTGTGQPIKRWNGTSWIVHYISVDNLNVKELSAITANLGTVTAGVIQNVNKTLVFDVTNGSIRSLDGEQEMAFNLASITYSGKDPDRTWCETRLDLTGLRYSRKDNTSIGCNITFEDYEAYVKPSNAVALPLYGTMTSVKDRLSNLENRMSNAENRINDKSKWVLLHEVAGAADNGRAITNIYNFNWIVVACCTNEAPYRVLSTSVLSVPNAIEHNSSGRRVESAYGGEPNNYTAMAYFPNAAYVICRSKSGWDRSRVYGVY